MKRVGFKGRSGAYLSSGTWSLLGLELPAPIVNEASYARQHHQRRRLRWHNPFSKKYHGVMAIARGTAGVGAGWSKLPSCGSVGDNGSSRHTQTQRHRCNDASLFAPNDMPQAIIELCYNNHQPEPRDVGEVTRCIFDSLAAKYAEVLSELTHISGKSVDVLHVVGGGAQNKLLCELTSQAAGVPVLAGPVEATALGNAITQLIYLGELRNMHEGRQLLG